MKDKRKGMISRWIKKKVPVGKINYFDCREYARVVVVYKKKCEIYKTHKKFTGKRGAYQCTSEFSLL